MTARCPRRDTVRAIFLPTTLAKGRKYTEHKGSNKQGTPVLRRPVYRGPLACDCAKRSDLLSALKSGGVPDACSLPEVARSGFGKGLTLGSSNYRYRDPSCSCIGPWTWICCSVTQSANGQSADEAAKPMLEWLVDPQDLGWPQIAEKMCIDPPVLSGVSQACLEMHSFSGRKQAVAERCEHRTSRIAVEPSHRCSCSSSRVMIISEITEDAPSCSPLSLN